MNRVAPGFVLSTQETQEHWDAQTPEAQRAHLTGTFRRRVGRVDDVSNAAVLGLGLRLVDHGSGDLRQRRGALSRPERKRVPRSFANGLGGLRLIGRPDDVA